MVLGNRFGLRISVVASSDVDEAPSLRVCKIGERRRGKSRGSGLMSRIVKGPWLLDVAWKKGALSSLE